MADCNDLFGKYHDAVKLAPAKRDNLKTSRDAVRYKIRSYFKNILKANVPKFHGQGSYMMRTTVNPLNGEFDIDDGVYLQNLSTDRSKWDAPEKVHGWIVAATDGHTNEKPIDKNRCVRVRYANNYHIDLPIYCMDRDTPYLAEKGKEGWHISDPKALIVWFNSTIKSHGDHGDQLKRIIRYFKAWADFQEQNSAEKMPSGVTLTVLACNNFEFSADRDDASLVGTARKILSTLEFSKTIMRPVNPYDDLGKDLTLKQMDNFMQKLKTLRDEGGQAIKETDKSKASKKWIKLLGDRFPNHEPSEDDKTSKAMKTSAPAILGSAERSA
ncbi:MAG: hypothetical protein HZA11_11435 [Nitrospirae bacterium]|nr:hypothetical protein [Nitrospirota bacterium]